MARIPVEKREAGFPWWGWILALLIAVGAIWLIAELLDNDAEVEPIETAAVYEADRNMDTEEITSFTMVLDPVTAQTLAGKRVNFQDMKVTSVVGDQAFYVEPADSADAEDILVVLDEVPTPGTETEGRYDVTAGQQLAIKGRILKMDQNIMNELDITEQEASKAQDDKLYIRAQSLNIRS